MEDEYHERCRSAAKAGPVYLFIDKINAEIMADSIVPMRYKPWWHENIIRFIGVSDKMAIETEFFDVYEYRLSKLGALK